LNRLSQRSRDEKRRFYIILITIFKEKKPAKKAKYVRTFPHAIYMKKRLK